MEAKYIFALIVLGMFFILIFISFAFLELGRVREERLQAWVSERYSDKNINKRDYESDDSVEVTPIKAETVADDVVDEEEPPAEVPIEDPYAKIDIEGIEEITGNYKG